MWLDSWMIASKKCSKCVVRESKVTKGTGKIPGSTGCSVPWDNYCRLLSSNSFLVLELLAPYVQFVSVVP